MDEYDILRAQAGDTDAFRALVDRFTPVAWQVACILMSDRGHAEDALQEAWLDVWRGLPGFDPARPFRPWLLAIVANRCRMRARRRGLPEMTLDDALCEALPDHQGEALPLADHMNDALEDALAGLPPDSRQLLALRFQAELDLAEIATYCSLPLSTVKSRLYRILAVLRKQLTRRESAPHAMENSR